MNKFEYSIGDRVKVFEHIYPATGVVIDVTRTTDGVEVVFVYVTYFDPELDIKETCINEYYTDEIELIPHPDTARLDWIIKNGARIEGNNGEIEFFASLDDDSIAHGLIGIREEISERMKPRCPTFGRPVEKCGCPDCGSSLVQYNP